MWQQLWLKWQTALLNRNIESFFLSETQNRADLRTQYQKLGSVSAFSDWLQGKAQEEALGSNGGMLFSVGGVN